MINNPRRVKDLIKNLSDGDSGKMQLLQRRYVMERFLERIAESEYSQNLVLKGGMLVTSMLDVGKRMTRDTDITMQNMALNVESAVSMAEKIASISLDDGMSFDVMNAYEIMEDSEYGGVRIEIKARFGKMEIPMKLDLSTGDILTPSAIEYHYKLMLEDRTIEILAYNVETVLAEKIETMLMRSTLNTRMRDFYDMWALSKTESIDFEILAKAIRATIEARNHEVNFESFKKVTDALSSSEVMQRHWIRYQTRNDFASDVSWQDILSATRSLCENARLVE